MTQTEPRRVNSRPCGMRLTMTRPQAVAPRGQRFREGRVYLAPDRGQRLQAVDANREAIVEVADMRGNPVTGTWGSPRGFSDGAIVLASISVRFPVTLSDVTGDSPEISGADIEADAPRLVRQADAPAPRLTPVHHIIGKSGGSGGVLGPADAIGAGEPRRLG